MLLPAINLRRFLMPPTWVLDDDLGRPHDFVMSRWRESALWSDRRVRAMLIRVSMSCLPGRSKIWLGAMIVCMTLGGALPIFTGFRFSALLILSVLIVIITKSVMVPLTRRRLKTRRDQIVAPLPRVSLCPICLYDLADTEPAPGGECGDVRVCSECGAASESSELATPGGILPSCPN